MAYNRKIVKPKKKRPSLLTPTPRQKLRRKPKGYTDGPLVKKKKKK